MRHTEFLIVGQGICGTFLSWYLHKAGRPCLITDNGNPSSSSRVAAGIINPVTGRRIVKTWMIDELLPFVLNSYSELGKELGIETISEKTMVDFFPSPQMLLAFTDRLEKDPQYLTMPSDPYRFNTWFNYDFGFGEINPCYAVQLATLLPAWRKFLINNNQLIEGDFDTAALSIQKENIIYKDIIADKIIFCDGIQSAENPWFRNLPFALNKGEALIIRANEIPVNNIYKKGVSLVPLAEKNIFWVGSSYEWNYNDVLPTKIFREKTIALLNHWLKSSFTVEDHLSSLRPATIERRPFVGVHPHHPRIAILNGMGTKGCSLAPYFAKQLADHLTGNSPILPDANINRFARLLQK